MEPFRRTTHTVCNRESGNGGAHSPTGNKLIKKTLKIRLINGGKNLDERENNDCYHSEFLVSFWISIQGHFGEQHSYVLNNYILYVALG